MHRRVLPLRIPTPALLFRLAHSLPQSNRRSPDPRLGFVREQLRSLDKPPAPQPERLQQPSEPDQKSGTSREVVISHPWPEWVRLMELLLSKGYLDRLALRAGDGSSSSSSSSLNASKDSNLIRTACLNFARERFDIIRYLSREDIHIIGQAGCPSIDRKVVNSSKRLRAHVGIQEGDVCSSCSLRGNCERAYVKAREEEVGRTVDVMRILLTYGLDIITGSVESPACRRKTTKKSVMKLLNEMVEFSSKEFDPSSLTIAAKKPLQKQGKSSGHQLFKDQLSVPMKQGDWFCPICNFLNFAKNIKCLRCNGECQERFQNLQADEGHLPLKKGDWICEKCNFLNFAKNTKCLQCHEKPSNRQLNPGEWECVSCNYINFRKNAFCLKCDWKRPKILNTEDLTRPQHSGQADSKGYGFSFVRDNHIGPNKFAAQEDDADFWSSGEGGDDNNNHKLDSWKGFDKFPIVGGRSAVSRDPVLRERWKEKMSKRRHGEPPRDFVQESDGGAESDDCSSEDEIAEWFGRGMDTVHSARTRKVSR